MVLVDTHAHLTDPQFEADRSAVLQRAAAAGVIIITVGIDIATSIGAVELARQHDGVFAAVGVHPNDALGWTAQGIVALRRLSRQPKVVAIGETGLDWYRDHAPRAMQREAFAAHLTLAEETGLPVIVHNRQADDDVLAMVRAAPGVRGVLHAFAGDWPLAEAALSTGWYVSFGGPLTYKNAQRTRAVALATPLERLLIETDCPYLPPVPHRGQRNEPSYVRRVAEELVGLHGCTLEQMAQQTTSNATALFRLPAQTTP